MLFVDLSIAQVASEIPKIRRNGLLKQRFGDVARRVDEEERFHGSTFGDVRHEEEV